MGRILLTSDFLQLFWPTIRFFQTLLVFIGLFQKFFLTPLLWLTIFRSHTPLEFYLIFHHPPLEFHTIFSRSPLEFHGNPLSSIMTPLEFSRFSFLRPPWNFRYPQQGGSGKFLEKPIARKSQQKEKKDNKVTKNSIVYVIN